MYNIIGKSKIFIGLSLILVIMSIIAIFVFGLNFGIDFTGGSIINVRFKNIERPSIDSLKNSLSEISLSNLIIQPLGNDEYTIKTQNITEETHQQIISTIESKFITSENQEIEELRFDSISPSIGSELKIKTLWAVILALFAIGLYIAYVFYKVSKPIESWKYGMSAILALLTHDVVILVGIFSVLGYFLKIEIDAYFIPALLTLLGYSINDTIVTFDRIRENLHKKQNLTFKELINESINETLPRTINTSFTTMITLIAVLFFGGETIRYFVLALLIGIILGTYSSIFIASPLLLWFYNLKYKQNKTN